VNVNLNEESFNAFCDFVYYSNTIEEIDIRWAPIRPHVMNYLLETLSTNSKLTHVNIAQNILTEYPSVYTDYETQEEILTESA